MYCVWATCSEYHLPLLCATAFFALPCQFPGLGSFGWDSGQGFEELARSGEVVAILDVEAEGGGEAALIFGGVEGGLGSFELVQFLDVSRGEDVGDCGCVGCRKWV